MTKTRSIRFSKRRRGGRKTKRRRGGRKRSRVTKRRGGRRSRVTKRGGKRRSRRSKRGGAAAPSTTTTTPKPNILTGISNMFSPLLITKSGDVVWNDNSLIDVGGI